MAPPSVLIVDDEPAIRRIIDVAIRSMGFDTITAPDAETGLELLQDSHPELILVDVRLPGIDGVEFAKRVKQWREFASTPVFLMSAYSEPRTHQGDGFLPKPFDIDQLTDLVERHTKNGS
jgi:CheY-like chemotaxis protein